VSLFDQLVVMMLPLAPKALVKRFASRYVAGETMAEMLETVRRFNQQGMMATVDVLGEFIHHKAEALQAAQEYKDILAAISREGLDANISVKLSQMGLLLDQDLCTEIMEDLISTAAKYRNFVRIDMEDSACTSDTLNIYLKLRRKYDNVGVVLQAYLRRTLGDTRQVSRELERLGVKANYRLCKGIYVEPRQIAFKDHKLINKNYALVLEEMFKIRAYVGIATHNEELVWEAMRLIDEYHPKREEYEFQMLLGVDPELRNIILDGGHRLRVYIPFGKQWYAYCMRRLKENPSLAWHIIKNMLSPGDISRQEV
jgi:proline dehydrogenase